MYSPPFGTVLALGSYTLVSDIHPFRSRSLLGGSSAEMTIEVVPAGFSGAVRRFTPLAICPADRKSVSQVPGCHPGVGGSINCRGRRVSGARAAVV